MDKGSSWLARTNQIRGNDVATPVRVNRVVVVRPSLTK